MAKRRLKTSDVIAAPHWRPFRLVAEDALLEQRVTFDGIHAMDRRLVHVERQKALAVTAEAVLVFFNSTSPNPIAALARALHAVDPTYPHLPSISQAMEAQSRGYRPAKPTRARSGRRPCPSSCTSFLPTGRPRSPT